MSADIKPIGIDPVPVIPPPIKPTESAIERESGIFGKLLVAEGSRKITQVVYYVLSSISAAFSSAATALSKTKATLHAAVRVLFFIELYNNIRDIIYDRSSWQNIASNVAGAVSNIFYGFTTLEVFGYFRLSDFVGMIGSVPVLGSVISFLDITDGSFSMWHNINDISRIGNEVESNQKEVAQAEKDLENAGKLRSVLFENQKIYGSAFQRLPKLSGEMLHDHIAQTFGLAVANEADAAVQHEPDLKKRENLTIEFLQLKYLHKVETLKHALTRSDIESTFAWASIAANVGKIALSILIIVGLTYGGITLTDTPFLVFSAVVFTVSLHKVYRDHKLRKFDDDQPKMIPHERFVMFNQLILQQQQPVPVAG